MNARHKVILSTGLVAPLLFMGSALAETSPTTTTDSTTGTSATVEKEMSAKEIQARVDKRKAELKLKISTVEQAKIKGKCKAAQSLLNGVDQRLGNAAANHTKALDKTNDRLAELITKLSAQGIDTAKLESEKAALETKITAYKADLTSYQQSIKDMRAMDCVTDPTGFKASLEAARTTREKLHKSVTSIRAYIKDTIKPILAGIRAQLEATKTETPATTGGNQ